MTIQEYIKENPIDLYDYRDTLEKSTIIDIIEKGIDRFYDYIYECNMDYADDLANDYLKNLYELYEDEIQVAYKKEHGGAVDFSKLDIFDIVDFMKWSMDLYPILDFGIDRLLEETTILAHLTVYSNYDCTTSIEQLEDEGYLHHTYKLLQKGIKKDDFLREHSGIYGGSLLIFPFSISLKEFMELKEKKVNSKFVTIPRGSTFGFFSEFLGSTSEIEKTTCNDITIPLNYGSTQYDTVELEADCNNNYSLEDIFGGCCFSENNIIFS
jgi:hypothetical protein